MYQPTELERLKEDVHHRKSVERALRHELAKKTTAWDNAQSEIDELKAEVDELKAEVNRLKLFMQMRGMK